MEPNEPNGKSKEKENFIPYDHNTLSDQEMADRSITFLETMRSRRSIRDFSQAPICEDILHAAIEAASTAPSGAHRQPWTFCLISDAKIKSEIRKMAEKEEFDSYNGRMNEEWLEAIKPFGTDHIKPFLEIAPYLIVVFKKTYDLKDGQKFQNYYVNESVGIAVGFLLCALQHAGLATLTHTPSPMNFLCEILGRPKNEKPFLLIPVGYPANDAMVPNIKRKPLNKVLVQY